MPAPPSPVCPPLLLAAPPRPQHFLVPSFHPQVPTALGPAPDDPAPGPVDPDIPPSAPEDFASAAREASHSSLIPPTAHPSHMYNPPTPNAFPADSPTDYAPFDGVVTQRPSGSHPFLPCLARAPWDYQGAIEEYKRAYHASMGLPGCPLGPCQAPSGLPEGPPGAPWYYQG
ncbi:proline-rich receptor-like protein kinase PERK2 [Homarus americanus]|uniref:proline-rich receptor-like protein kinase PERK2 n=1 Tax=Homarus americanus TaxID=6706 RepID=UPI001C481A85|nr:proline-rich receptor-like protein kinase PERK2 [Homarus americanus]